MEFFGLWKLDNIVKKTTLNEYTHAYLAACTNRRILWNENYLNIILQDRVNINIINLKFVRIYDHADGLKITKYFTM